MTTVLIQGRGRGETSVETVLLVPVLLLVLFIGVHVASLARAGQVAHVAATRGAEAAASSDPGAMRTRIAVGAVLGTVHDFGGTIDGTPTVANIDGRPTVTVRMRIEGIVPGLPVIVSRSVSGASETFIDADVRK